MQGNQGDKLSVRFFLSVGNKERETRGEGREEGDRGKQSVTKKINGMA